MWDEDDRKMIFLQDVSMRTTRHVRYVREPSTCSMIPVIIMLCSAHVPRERIETDRQTDRKTLTALHCTALI